ncbi:hypothetical protein CKO51_00875 [Rhodopirellula sp. SM50]|nr:hypothetical protein CKO51_00875 [Rhodopirellula sp. SM50]
MFHGAQLAYNLAFMIRTLFVENPPPGETGAISPGGFEAMPDIMDLLHCGFSMRRVLVRSTPW